MKMKSQTAFENFNKTFPPDVTLTWTQLVEAWDKDNTKTNPYEEPTPSKFISFLLVLYSLTSIEKPLHLLV